MRLVHNRKKVSGFTLVEMAIVLVIIGIILAGVMKGRDIVRGAQVKQFSQQFAQKWTNMASSYYDKTGQFLNDGTPNGGATGVDPNGWMDGDLMTNAATVYNRLVAVGVNPCLLVKSKMTTHQVVGNVTPAYSDVCNGGGGAGTVDRLAVFQTTVDGEYAAACVVSVDLVGQQIIVGGQTYTRNLVVIYNVPTDVANGLDTAIDGVANGLVGSCIGLAPAAVKDTITLETAADAADAAEAWGAGLSGVGGTAQTQTMGIIMDF